MYPLSTNSRYFSILRASASVAMVPGLHKRPWFRIAGRKSIHNASTTVTSHTSCLPISQGIMVTPSHGNSLESFIVPRITMAKKPEREPTFQLKNYKILHICKEQFYRKICDKKAYQLQTTYTLTFKYTIEINTFFRPLTEIMNLRHQSSIMCVIILAGEDTHPWSAPKRLLMPPTKLLTPQKRCSLFFSVKINR